MQDISNHIYLLPVQYVHAFAIRVHSAGGSTLMLSYWPAYSFFLRMGRRSAGLNIGPVVHPRNFKRLCMGDKVPLYSVSNILDNWSLIVSRITRSCTAIQPESNKLFFVIIKCVFVEIFRKFQRHCFYSFPRDFCL